MASPVTYAPLNWKGLDLAKPQMLQQFQYQVCDLLNQLIQVTTTASGLAGTLNGQGSLLLSAFTHLNVTSITGTTNCAGASIVTASLAITSASTMTLTNVADATLFDLRIANTAGVAETFKIAMSNPAATAYTVLAISGAVIATEVDLTATGISIPSTNRIYLRGIAQNMLASPLIAMGYV